MEKLENRSMYLYAKDAIMKYILNYTNNERLPSEQEFAKMMGVSRNTVREAIRILEREGVLYSRHGVGTFVVKSGHELTTCISELESATKIMLDHGYAPSTSDRYIEVREADEKVASRLCMENGGKILYIERVRAADGIPVVYVQDYILYEESIETEYEKSNPESLLTFLEEKTEIKIDHVVCGIKAVISDSGMEKKMHLGKSKALLLLEQTHYSTKGKPVFYSDSYFLSEKFNFNVIRKSI